MVDRGQRFPLSTRLPDMICGANGVEQTQAFRPTYFTAKWSRDGTALIEVAIWGPRLLSDGSIGKRTLDHCWRAPRSDGGVNLVEVPPTIAKAIRQYAKSNGLGS